MLFVVAGPNTSLQNVTCIVSMGYFVFDFCWCLYHQSEGTCMLYYDVTYVHVTVCRATKTRPATFGYYS